MPALAHPVAAAHLATFSIAFCQPLQLLINFSLFQYLLTVYFARRQQPRVVLLLLTATVGFLTLMPFAIADKQRVAKLHAISEVCCYLTFLQQITILTRDVNRKLKLRSLVWFTWCAELLIIASIVIIALNVLEIVDERLHWQFSEHVDKILETVSLWFIVAFRFYFMAMVRGGWRAAWRSHRHEVLFYLLFMTHGYPFLLLKYYIDLDWSSVKGAYNRLTIVLCLLPSVKARYSEGRKRTNLSSFKPVGSVVVREPSGSTLIETAAITSRQVTSGNAILPQQPQNSAQKRQNE